MTTFEQWDRTTRSVKGPITLTRDQIATVEDISCRVADGPTGFAQHSKITCTNGDVVIVTLPAGEVHDRLNDDTAALPGGSAVFAASKKSKKAPAEDEDF